MLKNEPYFIGMELDEVSLPVLTKNSQNGDLLEVKRCLLEIFWHSKPGDTDPRKT